MKKAYLLAFCSLFLVSCASRAPSLNMLEERADYESSDPQQMRFYQAGSDGFTQSKVPVRSAAKVSAIYIYPHELPDHSYFWGAWLSVVTEKDHWVLSKPNAMPKAPAFLDISTTQKIMKKQHRPVPDRP